MKDGKPTATEDPRRRPGGARRGPMKRARTASDHAGAQDLDGHSGHGADSVRPYLREQLRMKALLPVPFPMPETQGRDEG